MALTRLEDVSLPITFFECPSCRRQYVLTSGDALTFRWRHPISLVLYGVQFDGSPIERATEIAATVAGARTREELQMWIREIRLELDEPTQQVGAILACVASEEELRRYLREVVRELDRQVASRPGK